MATKCAVARLSGAANASILRACTSQSARFGCRSTALSNPTRIPKRAFVASSMSLAKKFTQDHEWIELDGSTGTVGITDYAANALGDVVYIELPEVDHECSSGDVVAAVESVKSASDILSPVSGKIVEANSKLESEPKTINNSPEGDGWIFKIEVSDTSELDGLMDDAAYKKFTEEE